METLNQNGAITNFTYPATVGNTQTLTATLIPEVLVVTSGPEPITYYPVQAGDTWESIALAAYGDVNAGTALEEMLGAWVTLTEGYQLDLPDSISYEVDANASDNGQTDNEDPLGNVTSYIFSNGLITEIRSPSIDGNRISTRYGYDELGNLITVTDGDEQVTSYSYDDNGSLLTQRDAEGNTVEYQYSNEGKLLNEIAYLTPDPDGDDLETAADLLVTRYVYDSEHHPRFIVSAEGRVEELRYNSVGQRIATTQYLEGRYSVAALTSSDVISEADMQSWLTGQNLSQSGPSPRGTRRQNTRTAAPGHEP